MRERLDNADGDGPGYWNKIASAEAEKLDDTEKDRLKQQAQQERDRLPTVEEQERYGNTFVFTCRC